MHSRASGAGSSNDPLQLLGDVEGEVGVPTDSGPWGAAQLPRPRGAVPAACWEVLAAHEREVRRRRSAAAGD